MLKPARKPKDPEGRMPLAEHLRELRNRLFKSVVAIGLVTVVAAFYYLDIIKILIEPIPKCNAAKINIGTNGTCGVLSYINLLSPFTVALKVSLMAGVILSCPVWLYQLWAFLAPGLHRHEKKYTLSFVAAGFPLFLGGGYFAYKILPRTIPVLLGFTPDGATNLLPVDDYLDVVTRMVLVFGLAFELPLILVLMNFGGMVSGQRMAGWWRGMVMGITVFAAVATPTVDPLGMLVLAAPITVLYFGAVGVALLNDARRARRRAAAPDARLDDDEASALDLAPEELPAAERVTAQAIPEQAESGGDEGASLPARRERLDDDIT